MGGEQEVQTETEKLCSEICRSWPYRPSFSRTEDQLAWLILEQRYRNLWKFVQRQCEEYGSEDSEELLKLWFLYNDLNEIQFIGTDLYADVVFVKHKVPYLYRSVGRDGKDRDLISEENIDEMGKKIFTECLEQIKSGGKGKLYSYSKCFGKALYKYANIRGRAEETTIEIRKDAYVNAVSEDGSHDVKSLQKYIRETREGVGGTERRIPFFSVDMSNARENSVENLKRWLDGFLGEQEYIPRFADIFDPIGDAEVVSDFTSGDREQGALCSGVERFTLNKNEFCVLLYRYFSQYIRKGCDISGKSKEETEIIVERFENFIKRSVGTIPDIECGDIKKFYESILNQSISDIDVCKLQKIMENINWNREIFFMKRKKDEQENAGNEMARMSVYKGDHTDLKSKVWKEILFGAAEGKYSYFNYS